MKKVVTIIGARPQFIKHGPIEKILKELVDSIVIHTGQHFDENMNDIFFQELQIDKPKYNLGIHGGNHGEMTGNMMIEIEKVILSEKPDYILVYGDTNSTLAGALVGSKLHIPVIHVEAGLRSGDKKMPEEINRILTDNVSQVLLSPTQTGIDNLKKEGIVNGVFRVHDPMFVTVNHFIDIAKENNILEKYDLTNNEYYFITVHRPSNTDNKEQLQSIVNLLNQLDKKVIFPVHPRTRKKLEEFGLQFSDNVKLIEPIGYLEILNLVSHSSAVITDSGGLQKEAYILGKNIFTMRDTTEWVETIESGRNMLLLDEKGELLYNSKNLIENYRGGAYIDFYGQGESLDNLFSEILK